MQIFNENEGVWRTIGGRHIFIKNGQDLASAMKESGKFKTKKDETIEKQAETISEEDANKRTINSYKEATLDEDPNNKQIVLKNGDTISQLSKKEYDKISTDFANSLTDEEIKMIDSYATSPGLSGELNAGDQSTKYYFNTTDKDYFVSQNELNKQYTELYEKYKKDGSPQYSKTSYGDENKDAIEWVRKNVDPEISNGREREFLDQIQIRKDIDEQGVNSFNSTSKYYTPEEIKEAKIKYEKLDKLENEKRIEYNRNGYSERYRELEKEHEKIAGGNYNSYYYQEIANIDNEKVFNTIKYDFDKATDGDLKPMTYTDMLNLKKYSGSQSSNFEIAYKQTHEYVDGMNKLFNDKAITLDKDIVLFRRGREGDLKVGDTFTMNGVTSTSAFDTLPQHMPSGFRFGESSNYIVAPAGTKMVFVEKTLGKIKQLSNDEDDYKGLRRQHEVMLQPGTEYEVVSSGGWKNGKYTTDKILVAKQSSNSVYLDAYNKYLKEHPNSKMSFNDFKDNYIK